MKKILLLLILLLLVGCSTKNEKLSSNENQIVEEVARKYDYSFGVCRAGNINVTYSTLNRNDEIKIVDEDDDFYYFDSNGLILAVDKDHVRTDNDEEYEEWTGFTVSGAEMFSDFEMEDFITDFYKNDNVTVKDAFLGVLLVEYDGQEGYMYPSEVKRNRIVTYVAPLVETPTYSGGGGGGGSSLGGGGGGGNPSPQPDPPAPASSDEQQAISTGGLIPTAYIVGENKTEFVQNTDYEPVNGKILVNNTKTYITIFSRDYDIKILEADDEEVKVLINGYIGKIDRKYVLLENEEPYEKWDGYTVGGSRVYNSIYCDEVIDSCYKNDEVVVLDEIDDVCFVMLEDGTYGYIYSENISETKLPTYVAPPTPVVETPTYSGGGGGGGGGTPSPQPDPPAPPAPSSDYGSKKF